MTATTKRLSLRLPLGFVKILAGLRMTSDRSTGRWGYHRSPELAARQYKVEWAPSEAHADGVDKWAADLDIEADGTVRIPKDAVQPYFIEKGAHLMLNLYCDMPRGSGRFASLGFFKKPELYGFDSIVPQDENGDWTYSRPIHLTETGKTNFFFLLMLERSGGGFVKLTIHKVVVTRGKEHYHIAAQKYFPPKDGSMNNGVTTIETLRKAAKTHPDLRDLPIGKLVDAYLDWNA